MRPPPPGTNKIPAGIVALRERGVTIAAMARALELTEPTMLVKLNGRVVITCMDIFKLAQALDVEPGDLFDDRIRDLKLPHGWFGVRKPPEYQGKITAGRQAISADQLQEARKVRRPTQGKLFVEKAPPPS